MTTRSTFRSYPHKQCECGDKNCAVAHGLACNKRRVTTLYRIDIHDMGGTYFCEECAEEAMESGLFTEERVK